MSEFKKNKPSRTPNQLIAKLKERGLTINDELEATIAIRTYGYFRLSGYFGPLQSSKDTFYPGTTFKDILRLYHFDRKLRRITSQALKSIEVSIKSHLTNIMSDEYESDWYENEEIFMTEKKKRIYIIKHRCEKDEIIDYQQEVDIGMYSLLKSSIANYIDRNSESDFIKKFKKAYGSDSTVPSWMMMECISFGELSRLYSLIKPSTTETRTIAKYFGALTADNFTSWLYGFVVLRNACAHHARIWNRMTILDLKFPHKKEYKFISIDETKYKSKFYGISACILKCLSKISHEEYETFKTEFYNLTEEHGIVLSAMGFPTTLEPHDIWKKMEIETI
ncbi:MAG: Abi family protein [Crocinitomicaceae bacterium]